MIFRMSNNKTFVIHIFLRLASLRAEGVTKTSTTVDLRYQNKAACHTAAGG